MSEIDYHKRFSISQSAIKDWKDLCPRKWYSKWILKEGPRRSSSAMDFGSLLDTLCFTPKKLDSRFVVATVAKPSDSITKIVTEIYAHITQLNENIDALNEASDKIAANRVPHKAYSLKDNKDIVQKIALENDYYASKPEQAYNTIVDKGTAYFEFLSTVGKKTVITEIQLKLAQDLKEILFTDPVSAPFFVPKKGCQVIFQVQIFTEFEITGLDNVEMLPVKGALDIIHFNHKRKEVREVDLKFTSDAFKFNDWKGPVRMFDYPLQHSFYDYIIPAWLNTYEDGKYKDYAICNPLNVVIDDDNRIPILYEYTKNDLHVKRYGIENTQIRGWEDTLNEIAWHLDRNDWTRPREHIMNGRIFINTFKR